MHPHIVLQALSRRCKAQASVTRLTRAMPLTPLNSSVLSSGIDFTGADAIVPLVVRSLATRHRSSTVARTFMSRDARRPYDKLFRTVFSDNTEATALLRAHLPESLAGVMQWSSLTLEDASFLDDRFRDSESNLLYAIERKTGDPPVWIYVLLEFQSRADHWMPFRCSSTAAGSGIAAFRSTRPNGQLRAIVPIVFY